MITFLTNLKTEVLNVEEFKEFPFLVVWDNARIHTSQEINEYLIQSKIKAMKLPPYSPDLTIVENVI